METASSPARPSSSSVNRVSNAERHFMNASSAVCRDTLATTILSNSVRKLK